MQAEVKDRKFYVYEHRTLDTGRIFYIGKGHGYRATAKANRNTHWKRIVAKHGYSVRFIEKEMSESDAFNLEVAAIDFCKWAGVSLANVTDGGEGTSGLSWTDERRAKMDAAFETQSYKDGISSHTKQRWSDPEYKKRVSNAIKLAHTTPEAAVALSARSIKNWSDPAYVEKNIKARIDSWKSESRKQKAALKMVDSWQDESIRAKRMDGMMKSLETDELRRKRASSMLTAQAIANNRAAIAKAFAENPEKRKRQQEASQAAFKRPEVIAKKAASIAAFHEKLRQWIIDNGYKGFANKVTKKVMGLK